MTTICVKTKKPGIVVIGGGIAGLSAAYELVLKGKDVTLLESTHYLGGIMRSAKIKDQQPTRQQQTRQPMQQQQFASSATSSTSASSAALKSSAQQCVPAPKPSQQKETFVDFGYSSFSEDDINFMRLYRELEVGQSLVPIKAPNIIAASTSNPNEYHSIERWQNIFAHHQFGAFLTKVIEIGLMTEDKYLSYYYPNQEKFGNKTLGQFLSEFPELFQTVKRSFTALNIGDIDTMPLFAGLPLFWRKAPSLTLGGHSFMFTDALATAITKRNGVIKTGWKAVAVDSNAGKDGFTIRVKISSKNGADLETTIQASQIILACPLDRMPKFSSAIHPLAEGFKQVPSGSLDVRSTNPEFAYKHSVVALVKVDAIPFYRKDEENKLCREWTSCFPQPQPQCGASDVSLVRVDNDQELPNHLKLTFTCSNAEDLKRFYHGASNYMQAIETLVLKAFKDIPLFRDNVTKLSKVLHHEVILRYTPSLNGAAVFQLHHPDPKCSIWYAGQYMGTTAGVETACFTGLRAANALLGPVHLDLFDCGIRERERSRIQEFRLMLASRYLLTGAVIGVGASLALGILFGRTFVSASTAPDNRSEVPRCPSNSHSSSRVDNAQEPNAAEGSWAFETSTTSRALAHIQFF